MPSLALPASPAAVPLLPLLSTLLVLLAGGVAAPLATGPGSGAEPATNRNATTAAAQHGSDAVAAALSSLSPSYIEVGCFVGGPRNQATNCLLCTAWYTPTYTTYRPFCIQCCRPPAPMCGTHPWYRCSTN